MSAPAPKKRVVVPESDNVLVPDSVVAAVICVSRPTVWTFVRTDPDFPRPIKLAPQTTRFSLQAVRDWVAKKAGADAA